MQGQDHERDGVQKMIQDRLVPDFEHVVALERRFQRVRPERAQTDREKAKRGSDPEKGDWHIRRSAPHLPPKNLRND